MILIKFSKKINVKVIVVPVDLRKSSSNSQKLSNLLKKLHQKFKKKK